MRSMLLFALVTLPGTAAGQERLRVGQYLALPPQRVADALLPPDHPAIAKLAFERMGEPRPPAPFVPTIDRVRFYTASTPLDADFCTQREIVAGITPIPDAEAAWLEAPPRLVDQRMGSALYRHRAPEGGCDGTQPHFYPVGLPDGDALDAYRALAAATKLAARRGARLPFRVTCSGMAACDGPRDTLRTLPLGEITGVRLQEDQPDGRRLVHFELPLSGMTSTMIAVTYARRRITRIEYSVGMVVF